MARNTDYNKTLFDFILNSVKNKDALILDKNLKSNNNGSDKDVNHFNERNKKYNDLIEKYTTAFKDRSDFKNAYKKKFFWFVMPVYSVVIVASLFILIGSMFWQNVHLAVIISALGSLLTTIISLPTIIAKYLFPKDEDSNLVQMFQLLFNFDSHYYEVIEEAKKKISKDVNKK